MKREKPYKTPPPSCPLIQKIDWGMMSRRTPQKIFVWSKQGNYLDCAFPNPIYGHFLGGQKVKGKNVRDVLETQTVSQLLEAIQQTMKSGKPLQVDLALFGSQSAYRTIVRLFPLSEQIMGWVNDYPIAEIPYVPKPVRPTPPIQRDSNSKPLIVCSTREQEVCALICEGKSNAEIAHQLQLTERTVRFHLENLFRKCQVSSRLQLAQCAPTLLRLNRVSTSV